MAVDPTPFKLEWQEEPRGSSWWTEHSLNISASGTSLLSFFISFRSEASADMRGRRGSTASNVRDKIDFQEVWFPVLFPLLTCIVSTKNLLNWTNLCPTNGWNSQTGLFLLMGKLYESHVRNLLSVCGFQDHQLGNLKALSHPLSSGHSSARKTLNQSLHIQGALSPGANDHLSNVCPGWTVPSSSWICSQMGYDTIN